MLSPSLGQEATGLSESHSSCAEPYSSPPPLPQPASPSANSAAVPTPATFTFMSFCSLSHVFIQSTCGQAPIRSGADFTKPGTSEPGREEGREAQDRKSVV